MGGRSEKRRVVLRIFQQRLEPGIATQGSEGRIKRQRVYVWPSKVAPQTDGDGQEVGEFGGGLIFLADPRTDPRELEAKKSVRPSGHGSRA